MPDLDRVGAILAAALDLDTAEARRFVERECGADLELRAEVESLLAAHAGAGDFLERPAAVASSPDTAAAPHAAPLFPGSELGPYRILGELGRGGMGVVYVAEDTRLGRKVAVKILPAEYARDERRAARLRLEARAAAALAHPGIATVFALEEIGGRLCLACEYVRGETLREEISRGPVPAALLLDTGIQLARALAAAHAAGVVHRDLKPENVIRAESGLVKILDFGVARVDTPASGAAARLTEAGLVPGTPAYMSPEQLAGQDVDTRSDIFALGVLLFELATGRHPFETAAPASTAVRVMAVVPPRLREIEPGAPVGLERVVERCLQKDAADRYQSASDVADDLEALLPARVDGRVDAPWAGGADRYAVAAAGGDRSVNAARPAGRDRCGAKLLLRPSGGPPSARGWWILHHAGAMAVAAAMIWPAWLATRGSGWTTAILLAAVAAAALTGTVRAHLLFTLAFNEGELERQLVRAAPWLRLSDWLFAASLLGAALPAAASRIALAGLLAAVSAGWVVTSLLIEPATRRAAFGSPAPAARRR